MDDDRNWISITVLGSAYEQEVSECGRFQRHRPRNLNLPMPGRDRFGMDAYATEAPWIRGPAPDGTGQGNPPR